MPPVIRPRYEPEVVTSLLRQVLAPFVGQKMTPALLPHIKALLVERVRRLEREGLLPAMVAGPMPQHGDLPIIMVIREDTGEIAVAFGEDNVLALRKRIAQEPACWRLVP